MPSATKSFFILVAHSPLGTMGQVIAPELPSQEDRVRSRRTHVNTGVPLSGRQNTEP
jgi:hypothetical protein